MELPANTVLVCCFDDDEVTFRLVWKNGARSPAPRITDRWDIDVCLLDTIAKTYLGASGLVRYNTGGVYSYSVPKESGTPVT